MRAQGIDIAGVSAFLPSEREAHLIITLRIFRIGVKKNIEVLLHTSCLCCFLIRKRHLQRVLPCLVVLIELNILQSEVENSVGAKQAKECQRVNKS